MARRGTSLEWIAGLDMTWGGFKAGGTLVEVTVDMDVSKFPALEAGFMVLEMITGEGGIIVATSPSDFGVSDGSFFFFGQKGQQGRGGGVLRSSGSFFNEGLYGSKFLEVSVKVYDKVSHAKLVHDGDELHSELSLYIIGDMLDCECDGVAGCERGIYNYAKMFDLEVSLLQGFKGVSIVKVVIEGHSKVGISDSSNKDGMFSRGREQAESVTVD